MFRLVLIFYKNEYIKLRYLKTTKEEKEEKFAIPVILLPKRFAIPISWKSHSRNIYIAVLTKKFLKP